MRIALVTPRSEAGGLETFVVQLGKYFLSQGQSVTVMCTGSIGPWWDRLPGQGLQRCAVVLADSFSRLTHIRRVQRALRDFDVVILNGARYGQAALAGLPWRTIAISVVHNDLASAYDITCANAELADAVVAISPKTSEVLVSRLGPDKVVTIRHGVEAPPHELLRASERTAAEPKLIYVGRVVQEQKNVFLLPEILKRVYETGLRPILQIAGDGPDMPELRRRFRDTGMDGQVVYLGRLEPEEVRRALLHSHILLSPSFYEGFPLAPLESQACGCVPVLSRLPGITDYSIQEGKTGLLADSNNAESFASEACRLLRNGPLWESMSREGIAWIREEFTTDKMGREYLALIDWLLVDPLRSDPGVRRGSMWNPGLIGWFAAVPNRFCRPLGILAD